MPQHHFHPFQQSHLPACTPPVSHCMLDLTPQKIAGPSSTFTTSTAQKVSIKPDNVNKAEDGTIRFIQTHRLMPTPTAHGPGSSPQHQLCWMGFSTCATWAGGAATAQSFKQDKTGVLMVHNFSTDVWHNSILHSATGQHPASCC
jgi:hypothetical protein